MRPAPWLFLEPSRVMGNYGAPEGAFILKAGGATLHVIASSGVPGTELAWEHVSVSAQGRCPTWSEMCYIKDLFWDAEETVVQYHPPKSTYVNVHPHCLHLWKQTGVYVPLPPRIMV